MDLSGRPKDPFWKSERQLDEKDLYEGFDTGNKKHLLLNKLNNVLSNFFLELVLVTVVDLLSKRSCVRLSVQPEYRAL